MMTLLLFLVASLGCNRTVEDPYGRENRASLEGETQLLRITTKRPATAIIEANSGSSVLFWLNETNHPIAIVVRGIKENPCLAPATTGFFHDPQRNLVATEGPLPIGAMATLRLLEPGKFNYAVWINGRPAGRGIIHVKEGSTR